ncbi:50S ribosomal protein L21 [Prochlorococcus sp. MIT 0601]|uniref:50S ribosomal protein L21 n=1 Tax=Prochlorococcus sp. MIT 0601 TaxID=1499498 RepID=UPI000533BA66|nr:50S ribosomal protein L21 [Prochlorococcus sp. MIT 0601]KGG11929.1 LSU ribosomal protein L21p [Prochlorococcus sp. MIT 0601]
MAPNKTNTPSDSVRNYAIVEASGSQFWLEENRYYDFDRIHADVDKTVTLKKVLLLNDGGNLNIGKPYVEGATVEVKIMAHRRGSKIIVYKMRPKKKTRRKNGHRQELTRVMVQSISLGNKKPSAAKAKTATKATKATTEKVSKTSTKSKSPSKVKVDKEKTT